MCFSIKKVQLFLLYTVGTTDRVYNKVLFIKGGGVAGLSADTVEAQIGINISKLTNMNIVKVYYCNRDCQKKNWKLHKPICKSLPYKV